MNARNKKTGSPIVKLFEKYLATSRLASDRFNRHQGRLYVESNGDGAEVDWSCGEPWRDDDDHVQFMDGSGGIVSDPDIELYDANCPACMDKLGGDLVSDAMLGAMCEPCRVIAIENRGEEKIVARLAALDFVQTSGSSSIAVRDDDGNIVANIGTSCHGAFVRFANGHVGMTPDQLEAIALTSRKM